MSKKGPAKIQPACADAPVDGKLSLQDGSTIERGRLKASPTKAARSPSPNAHKYAIDGEDGKARDVTAVSDAHIAKLRSSIPEVYVITGSENVGRRGNKIVTL